MRNIKNIAQERILTLDIVSKITYKNEHDKEVEWKEKQKILLYLIAEVSQYKINVVAA